MTARSQALPSLGLEGRGILITVLAMLVFAGQDLITKSLVADVAVAQVVMVRFIVFAGLAAVLIGRRPGGIPTALRARRPWLQVVRALLLVGEIGLFAFTVSLIPLSSVVALFGVFPLVATAMAAVFLGERVGPLRWLAVAVGFTGVLVIVRPGLAVFDPTALLACACACVFALYNVLTRYVSADDGFATSYAYVAFVGCAASLLVGPWFWVWPDPRTWLLLLTLSATAITGHMLLQKALELAPASAVQPYTYTQLVFGLGLSVTILGERPDAWTYLGAAIIVLAGLTALRAR